ncbi:MAG: anti-sigma factor [Kiritimatiellia bacterium]
MNATQWERLLLLEQSGELSPARRRELDAALAASPEARQRRRELRGLAAVVRSAPVQPAPGSVDRIAARLRTPRKTAFAFLPAWKPTLAAAAALALVVGVRSYRGGHASPEIVPVAASASTQENEWSDPFDDELADLENLLLAISDSPYDIIEL